jgi:hypothetical protein
MLLKLLKNKSLNRLFALTLVATAAISNASHAGDNEEEGFALWPVFKLAGHKMTAGPYRMSDSFQCGNLPNVSVSADSTQTIDISQLTLTGKSIRFKLSTTGKCSNFDTRGRNPEINLFGALKLPSVEFPIAMDGQERCVSSQIDVVVNLPEQLRGRFKRTHASPQEFVLQLEPYFVSTLYPIVRSSLDKKLNSEPKRAGTGLNTNTPVAQLIGGIDQFCSRVDSMAFLKENISHQAASLLNDLLMQEMTMTVAGDEIPLLDDWTEANLFRQEDGSLLVVPASQN